MKPVGNRFACPDELAIQKHGLTRRDAAVTLLDVTAMRCGFAVRLKDKAPACSIGGLRAYGILADGNNGFLPTLIPRLSRKAT